MAEALPVRLNRVRKTYVRGDQETVIIDGVDLDVRAGQFVALMGPSGSGKSTLLNVIAGLDKPTSGKVTVGAHDPYALGETERCDWRARHIGFIFQRYHLLDVLTAAENVELPLLLFKMPKSERKRRVKTALELVGLIEKAQNYPRQLSGGQEQRVAVARAIVTDPSIIVADEPTGDLDAKSAKEILDLLTLLNQQLKKTVVMVTHDPKAAKRAQTLFYLEKGVLATANLGAERSAPPAAPGQQRQRGQ